MNPSDDYVGCTGCRHERISWKLRPCSLCVPSGFDHKPGCDEGVKRCSNCLNSDGGDKNPICRTCTRSRYDLLNAFIEAREMNAFKLYLKNQELLKITIEGDEVTILSNKEEMGFPINTVGLSIFTKGLRDTADFLEKHIGSKKEKR